MNALADKYGDKLAILGFPCNQFGHQTNEDNSEFLNTLKHVRPGNGFEAAPTVTLFEKTDVNGADAAPLFKWLKASHMIPCDEAGDTKGNGVDDNDALVLPRGKFGGSTVVLWTPVARSDIAWNFEASGPAAATHRRRAAWRHDPPLAPPPPRRRSPPRRPPAPARTPPLAEVPGRRRRQVRQALLPLLQDGEDRGRHRRPPVSGPRGGRPTRASLSVAGGWRHGQSKARRRCIIAAAAARCGGRASGAMTAARQRGVCSASRALEVSCAPPRPLLGVSDAFTSGPLQQRQQPTSGREACVRLFS